MFPSSPTATQSDGVGQETPRRSKGSLSLVTPHAGVPPVGSVEVTTRPFWPTATQSDGVGQEIPFMWVASRPSRASIHASTGPVGSLLAKKWPCGPAAAQNPVVGQETPRIALPGYDAPP